MKFKVGDKVFVKPFEEICADPNSTIRESDGAVITECDVETNEGVEKIRELFLPDMKCSCERQCTIERITDNGKYILEESYFNFLECWLSDELRHYIDSFEEE